MSARHRLEEEHRSLQGEWDKRNEKLRVLRIAFASEAGVALKFQLKNQIEDEVSALDALETRLEQIEGELATINQDVVVTENTRRAVENPFFPLTGRIEQAELFFNRQRELREIFDLLNGGSSVELLGERQIGKSSVLWQVKLQAETVLRVARRPIYLNLQEVHSEAEFYQSFCEKLGIATCNGYDLFRAMRQERVLLLLDEAEKMSWDGFTRNLREQLRSLAEGDNAPVRLVIATRTPLARLFPDSHEAGMTSPFEGICSRVELKLWEKNTALDFVRLRLSRVGCQFTNLELEKLWETSLGHPQKLMKAGFDLFRQRSNP